MTYRIFDELGYLKSRLEFAEREMVHVKKRVDLLEQSLLSSLELVDDLPIIVAHIMYQEANAKGLTVEQLRGPSQSSVSRDARGRAVFRIRELGKFSWAAIIPFFPGQTRATLETAYRRGKEALKEGNTNDRHSSREA